LLAKITAALVAFGPLGVFLLGFVDSAGIPVAAGMDALIILIGVKAPGRAYLTALLALAGSLGGNLLLFYLARRGGRRFVEPAGGTPGPEKPQRFRAWFDRYGLVTVFIPALLPIPLPLKVFVVSAGVLRTSVWNFIAVIVTARFIRYFGEAYLAIRLGEDASAFLTRNAWNMVGIAVLLFALLYAIVRISDRRRSTAGLR
jgi:membrane protein YqaA with SNARE-associated domain